MRLIAWLLVGVSLAPHHTPGYIKGGLIEVLESSIVRTDVSKNSLEISQKYLMKMSYTEFSQMCCTDFLIFLRDISIFITMIAFMDRRRDNRWKNIRKSIGLLLSYVQIKRRVKSVCL